MIWAIAAGILRQILLVIVGAEVVIFNLFSWLNVSRYMSGRLLVDVSALDLVDLLEEVAPDPRIS
jgi:hypothetical protein